LPNGIPGRLEFDGNTEFTRKDVHGSQRQDAEPGTLKTIGNIANAIQHFVQCAVATRGDHDFETPTYGVCGQPARIADGGGLFQRGDRREFIEVPAKTPRFAAFGGRIEDDTRAHGGFFSSVARE
jgi:hypothetical protein